jgi:hypothetical protein
MKYTLRDDSDIGKVLQKDGKDTFCPFQAPISKDEKIFRMPCSLLCPHAKLEVSNRCDLYLISCNGITEPFHIEKT